MKYHALITNHGKVLIIGDKKEDVKRHSNINGFRKSMFDSQLVYLIEYDTESCRVVHENIGRIDSYEPALQFEVASITPEEILPRVNKELIKSWQS